MDNLTHSLIGLVAGESIAQTTPANEHGLPVEVRRGLLVALAVIGGNLPDLDLLYSYNASSNHKLGYLLQHRGYTHTLLGCVLLASLLYAGTIWWIRWRQLRSSGRDRLELALVALFGTLLHLGMDTLNSYGVHPFWPVENRWFYGDAVFIVEPLYWAAAAPLFFVVRGRAARVVISLALIAAIGLSVASHLVPPVLCGTVALLMVGLLVMGARSSARAAAISSAVLLVGITATFIFSGHRAARRAESIAGSAFPADHVIDHVLTPLPMNAVCWDLLLLETRGDRYVVRHAMLSNAAAVMPARQCPTMFGSQGTAPMVRVAAADSGQIHWLGEFAMSTTTLRTLVDGYCDAAALMRFARVPFATLPQRRWVVGDLRFDREPGLGMSEIELTSPSVLPCPGSPPWIAPRSDLLAARKWLP